MSRPHSGSQRFGLSVALSTPFMASGQIDPARLIAHAHRCLADGAQSLTLFGTTGEGFSIGPAEREPLYAAVKAAGFEFATQVGVGVMAASVEEAAAQAAQAYRYGARHILLAPPFYFKGVSDAGVLAWHAAFIQALGPDARDLIVYNLPGQTAVTLSHDMVGHLKAAHPGVVIGVKDSGGNWAYTERMLRDHGDLAILIGDERHLARAVRGGGQGSICGLANICAAALRPLVDRGEDSPLINSLVETIVAGPVVSGIKAIIAAQTADAGWRAMRPPLDTLPQATADVLSARITALLQAAKLGV
jgi:4-hydroxy-tetrahydrodipicolinate synthase